MSLDRLALGRERISRVQALLARDGFNGLLLVNSTHLVWAAGYQSTVLTLARPFYLVVPAHGAPVLLVHRTRPWEARRHSWVEDVRTYDRLSVAPTAELAAIFGDLGLRGGRIGAELGFEQRLGIPPIEWARVVAELAPSRFDDAAGLLWQLRRTKDGAEIAALREAGSLTAEAYRGLFAWLRPGRLDREVSTRVKQELMTVRAGTAWATVAGGDGCCDLGIGLGVGRAYEPGEMIWFDAGCSSGGYWSDYSRAAVLGEPISEQSDAISIAPTELVVIPA